MGDAPCPVTATGCVPRDRQGAQAAGSAACPGKGPNFPERSIPIDEPRLNAFLGRALNDMGAAMSATLSLIGDQLGLYKTLARQPSKPPHPAAATEPNDRSLREGHGNQARGAHGSHPHHA